MAFPSLRPLFTSSAVLCLVLMFAGCVGVTLPPNQQYGGLVKSTIRRPALDELRLVEGLNLVDRVPSGESLAALVEGNEITDWRVFDDEVEIVFKQQSDDGGGFGEGCIISGGFPGISTGGRDLCCWDDWGCLACTPAGQCEMLCDTQACKDANGQTLPPIFPEDADGRPSVAVNPGGLVIAVDPEVPGWTVMNDAGTRMHTATRTREGICPICAQSRESHVCWELPCLPAAIKSD